MDIKPTSYSIGECALLTYIRVSNDMLAYVVNLSKMCYIFPFLNLNSGTLQL